MYVDKIKQMVVTTRNWLGSSYDRVYVLTESGRIYFRVVDEKSDWTEISTEQVLKGRVHPLYREFNGPPEDYKP